MASLRALGPRKWQLRWYLGPTETGGERYAYETFSGTRREAERRWAEEDLRRRQGGSVDAGRLTVGALLDRWLSDHQAGRVRPATLESYTYLIRIYLKPTLGAIPLRRLNVLDVQRAVRGWADGPRRDGRPGHPSARTVHYALAVLRAALQDAMRWRLISTNPAALAEPPRASQPERRWWSADETAHFLAETADRYGAIGWQLAILLGLRKGEVLGLRWGDIDWEKGLVHVRQVRLDPRRNGGAAFGPPKTDRGRRTLVADSDTLALLKSHRQAQRVQRIAAGPGWEDHDLVVATGLGRPWNARNLNRSFYQAIKASGAPAIRFHDLRHTHASLLRAAGVDFRVIADRLGHVQVSFTAETYAHADLADQRHAVDALRVQLGPSRR